MPRPTCLEHLYVEIVQFLIDSNLFASLLRLKFMDPAAEKKHNLNKLSEISMKFFFLLHTEIFKILLRDFSIDFVF